MHSPRNCANCGVNTMEFVTWRGWAFCDTECLVEFVRRGLQSRPTTGAADLLDAPACCASFVFDGTHHKDCRFSQPASG